jgi:hypothetical protein
MPGLTQRRTTDLQHGAVQKDDGHALELIQRAHERVQISPHDPPARRFGEVVHRLLRRVEQVSTSVAKGDQCLRLSHAVTPDTDAVEQG